MKERGIKTHLARPAVFRGWLLCVMADLDLPAQVVSSATGGVNAVGRFMKGGSKDLMLSRANAVEEFLHKQAAKQGKVLPPVTSQDVRTYSARVSAKLDDRFPDWRKSIADPAGCNHA